MEQIFYGNSQNQAEMDLLSDHIVQSKSQSSGIVIELDKDPEDIVTKLKHYQTQGTTLPFPLAWSLVQKKVLFESPENFFKYHMINTQDKFEQQMVKQNLVDGSDRIEIDGLLQYLLELDRS